MSISFLTKSKAETALKSQIFSCFVVTPSEPKPPALESLQKTLVEVMGDHPETPVVVPEPRKLGKDLQ